MAGPLRTAGATDGRATANGPQGRQSCDRSSASEEPTRLGPRDPRLGGKKPSDKNCSKSRPHKCVKQTEATQGKLGDTSGNFSWFLWSFLENIIV